jgi:hypothetical protein
MTAHIIGGVFVLVTALALLCFIGCAFVSDGDM